MAYYESDLLTPAEITDCMNCGWKVVFPPIPAGEQTGRGRGDAPVKVYFVILDVGQEPPYLRMRRLGHL